MGVCVNDRPSWHDIHIGCASIVTSLLLVEQNTPKKIIGVARGGLIPATILSHLLKDVPLIPINYSSKKGKGDNKNHSNELPNIKNETILIVDDIVDTGHSMLEIVKHFKQFSSNVITASLYYKFGAVYTPDFYMEKIPKDSNWIVMPWEI